MPTPPELRDIALGVGHEAHEAEGLYLEGYHCNAPEKKLYRRPYGLRKSEKRSREMPPIAAYAEGPRGIGIEDSFVKIVYVHIISFTVIFLILTYLYMIRQYKNEKDNIDFSIYYRI